MLTETRELTLEERFEAQLRRDLQDPDYLQEWLILCFSEQILAVLAEEGLSRTDLAERLGVSRQYVTKLINRTPNLTLHSLAEIAAALGRQVTVRLEPLPVSQVAVEVPEAEARRGEKPVSLAAPRAATPRRKRAAVASAS